MKKVYYVKVLMFLLSCILLSIFYNCNNRNSEIYDFNKIEVKPEPISIPPPEYPELAKKLGQEGTVVVRMIVDIDGTISYAEVEISSGYYLLDDAALDAAHRALFKPAMNDGEPVRCWVVIPYSFQLRD